MTDKLLDEKQAAEFLGLQPRTLASWRFTGRRGPKFVRISARCVRYRQQDLNDWTAGLLQSNTSEEAGR